MTIEARAEKLAREVVSSAANPFYVAATQHQQEKVIQAAVPFVLAAMRDLLREYEIKFEP